jgi:NH3-dependent NAD+ synthetase
MADHQKTVDALLAWIQQTTPDNARVLVPVSGGSDSALCFWLYNKALPGRVEGVCIGASLRAQQWFEQTGTVRFISLDTTGPNPEIQRWSQLLTLSIQENLILAGSRNRTEDILGTFSHASRVCSALPLAGTWKSQVMELCAFIGLPEEILQSSRQADPQCGRPKRMSDIAFQTVDAFLQAKLANQGLSTFPGSPDQLAYLEEVYARNAYKQHLPYKGVQIMAADS